MKLRNKAVAAQRFAKCSYFMNLSNHLNSPKRFWNAYRTLSSNRRVPHLLTLSSVTAESTPAEANLLNSFFTSCFSTPQAAAKRLPNGKEGLSTISCSSEEVASIVRSLKTKSASGPNGISTQMLKTCTASISEYHSQLFNQSLSSGSVPTD